MTDDELLEHSALAIVSDVRNRSPRVVLGTLVIEAVTDPLRIARLCMALAAMVDDTETTGQLTARVGDILAGHRTAGRL